jgi:hypothetical protein
MSKTSSKARKCHRIRLHASTAADAGTAAASKAYMEKNKPKKIKKKK